MSAFICVIIRNLPQERTSFEVWANLIIRFLFRTNIVSVGNLTFPHTPELAVPSPPLLPAAAVVGAGGAGGGTPPTPAP